MNEMDEKVDETQEQPSDRPPLREVSPEDLWRILEAHRKWVESEGKEGERADLSGANLSGAYLFRANLQEAFLVEANLIYANLQEANLIYANLQGAKLTKALLFNANLQGAILVKANGLAASQIKKAENWKLAFYSDDLLKKLGLPSDHNERVIKKLAELERDKKATGAK